MRAECHPVHDPALGCGCARGRDQLPFPMALIVVLVLVFLAIVLASFGSGHETPQTPPSVHVQSSLQEQEPSVLLPVEFQLDVPALPASDLAPPVKRESVSTVGVPAQVLRLRASVDEPFVSHWVPRRCAEVADYVVAAGMPEWMTLVAWRESRCIASVRNLDRSTGDESWGLFQINTLGRLWGEVRSRCGLRSREQLLDQRTNVACASKLFTAYGFRPWHAGRYFS